MPRPTVFDNTFTPLKPKALIRRKKGHGRNEPGSHLNGRDTRRSRR